MIGHEPVDEAVRSGLNGDTGEGTIEKVGVTGDLLLEALVENGDIVVCGSGVRLC